MGLLDGSDCAHVKTIKVEDLDRKKVQVENPAYVT
jgi:hypothetical protein